MNCSLSWPLLFALALPGCPPPQPVVVLIGDAGGGTPCQAACAVLLALDCPEGKPSPGGHPCGEVCESAKDLLPVACIDDARTKVAVQACGVRCQQ